VGEWVWVWGNASPNLYLLLKLCLENVVMEHKVVDGCGCGCECGCMSSICPSKQPLRWCFSYGSVHKLILDGSVYIRVLAYILQAPHRTHTHTHTHSLKHTHTHTNTHTPIVHTQACVVLLRAYSWMLCVCMCVHICVAIYI
jgi:hypothetical protein